MKKENWHGYITITSEREKKFENADVALMAAQTLQLEMTQKGYLTTSTFNTENRKLEVTVHFSDKLFPSILKDYQATWCTITSQEYWNEYEKRMRRIRCLNYYFEY